LLSPVYKMQFTGVNFIEGSIRCSFLLSDAVIFSVYLSEIIE